MPGTTGKRAPTIESKPQLVSDAYTQETDTYTQTLAAMRDMSRGAIAPHRPSTLPGDGYGAGYEVQHSQSLFDDVAGRASLPSLISIPYV